MGARMETQHGCRRAVIVYLNLYVYVNMRGSRYVYDWINKPSAWDERRLQVLSKHYAPLKMN